MKWHQRFAILGIAILAVPVLGLDQDGNGMSDVWEQLYPAVTGDPTGDPDGDQISNLDEARAGTNPLDPASAFRIQVDNNTGSSVSWGTSLHHRYRLLESHDLLAWNRIGRDQNPVHPTNLAISVASPGNGRFYHVRDYGSLNSDTDALTNEEETRLGTDPERRDTDGDKAGDDVEFNLDTDPLTQADDDGDGLPDDWERWIIHAAQHDEDPGNNSITNLNAVLPADDFDGDARTNQQEYDDATSPVSAQRNVVLIFSDDQSNHLGILGTPGIDTPNLDQLGTNGVIFTRAFAAISVCSPSRGAILTGMYPHGNGLFRNAHNYGLDFPLPGDEDPSNVSRAGLHEDIPTLIEILKDNGFFTGITQKSHVQPIRKFPFSKGYNAHNKPAQYTSAVNQTVADADGRPFFLMANISAPHRNFDGHLNANGLLNGAEHPTNVDPGEIEVPDWLPDTPAMRDDLAKYYACVEVVDMCCGAIFDALEANGALDNTLIIFTSDNGMGYHRAKVSAYAAGLHMPFLVNGPEVSGRRTLSEPVSHVDVVPTILEFLGIPVHQGLHGKSLVPILTGRQNGFPDRDTVMGTINEQYMGRMVCDGRYYFIHNITRPDGSWSKPPMNADLWQESPWGNHSFQATIDAQSTHAMQYEFLAQIVEGRLPTEELYDLENDPWQVNNLVNDPAHSGTAARLRRALRDWRYATEDANSDPLNEIIRRTDRYHVP